MVSKRFSIYFLLLVFSISLVKGEKLLGDTDGTWNYLGSNGYAGNVLMNPLTGSSYFYWLFNAVNGNIFSDNLPLVIWIWGGPGCSGDMAMMYDNIGPFILNSNGQPVTNPLTWTNNYHVMTIDHPLGTGFSLANVPSDFANSTTSASNTLYNFLVKLAQKYPTWFNRDLYFFGESYAGHWIPGIAYKILSENNGPSPLFHFNLKGIGIGDPWIDPATQGNYSGYAYQNSYIDKEELQIIQSYEENMNKNLNNNQLIKAHSDWSYILDFTQKYAGGFNIYNVREFTQLNSTLYANWLNLNSTKTLLHAPLNVTWVDCSGPVYNYLVTDMMITVANLMPFIIDNIKVIIWNGQDDFMVNTLSTENMLNSLKWTGISNLINSKKIAWKVNGSIAGYVINYQSLTYALLLKAGHMGSHDQPANARDMINRFISNQGWN